MYKTLSKNGQAIGFTLGAVISVLYVLILSAGWNKFSALGESPDRYDTAIFNFGLYAAFALVIAGGLIVVAFGIGQMATDPKGALKGIIGVAVLVAIFLIAYSTASGEATGPIARAVENAGGISANGLKLISGGIVTAIALAVLASLGIVVSELLNFFK